MSDAPALLAGRYRLAALLGRGGMGEVWLARDEVLERDVAVKEIDQPTAEDGDAAARRTLREARAAARLSHPGVVQVYDVLQLDGRTWIVMEYVPSRSLRQVVQDDGPLEPYRVARIGLDLLSALRAAHRVGVQHRDVKPANVLLADDGRVLLSDFGIAAVDDDAVISRSDVLVGSPQFMAPERAQTGAGGPEADLWSLGATLYAAVEGRAPFQRGSTMATLAALTTEEPEPPQRAGALRPLLDGLLRKDPAARMEAEDADSLLRRIIADLADEEPQRSWGPAPGTQEEPEDQEEPQGPQEPGDGSDRNAGTQLLPVPKTDGDRAPQPAQPKTPRRALLAGAAALTALVAAGAVWLVADQDPEDPAAQRGQPGVTRSAGPDPVVQPGTSPTGAGPTGSSSTGAAPSATRPTENAPASPDGGAAGARPDLPAGWRDYRDATGFEVYVPSGWKRSKEGTMVYFRGDGKVLGIDQTDRPKSDPVADWRSQSDYRVDRGDFPGYREIKIESVPYFRKAADWEFTFSRNGVRQHVNNRGVVVADDKAYGFYWQTSDAAWAGAKDDLQLVFDSFVPAD
ncbi:protein kinase [Actinoplanes sp. NBC_00393]|uniref:serine/threonine-protein kinase n=1 Tax=Actinoplanes sp. NBC_00393 TaxID=2975953 RepID=UPI002E1A64F9